MKGSTSRWGFALAAILAGVAGAAALKWAETFREPRMLANSRVARTDLVPAGGKSGNGKGATTESLKSAEETYIVVFNDSALAGYHGEVDGLPAPPKAKQGRGRGRPDLKSPEALAYLGYLDRAQQAHEEVIRKKLGRPLRVSQRMKHALNAITTDMSPEEASSVQKLPGVRLVEQYREYKLDTDLGPKLIGAPAIWQGTYPSAAISAQGEGVVVGIIDTGINFGSPSFAGTDPVDGYHHVNPLGAGTYLGTCAGGGVDAGLCTDKLIGAYDFVCNVVPDPAFPSETTCSASTKYRESPGGTDTDGHGSHTASTVAGDHRDVVYRGASLRLSGVAPRASVIAYDVCYYNVSTATGACPNVSAVAAVNQAVADGVDVINYSISGGNNPWSDSVSLAFLNATDAGIYVAAAAGNEGPAPGTVGHLEPWVGATAAANSGRAGFSFALNVTGPGQVPANLAPLMLAEGADGVSLGASLPGTTPLVVSPRINAVDDGCTAYTAGTFQNAIAVVRRGSCNFSVKVNNAAAAGALVTVIANNQVSPVTPSVPGTTIPVFAVSQADGDALRDFATPGLGATGGITYPPIAVPNVTDALAGFSSRGPGTYDLMKPNITAPGVSILAAISNTTGVDDDAAIGLMSGTSMASPHHAGAAALMRQLRPSWSVPEILSALQMTANTVVYKEDTVTLGTPFDRGSGRIQVDRAVNAGLVLNEVKANFMAANPLSGGNPSDLNLASMVNRHCPESCTFTRTFRNTKATRQTWTTRLQGLPGSIWPSRFTINSGETRTLTIRVVTTAQVPDGTWAYGSLKLQPDNSSGSQPSLNLPIAVAVQPPVMGLYGSAPVSLTSGNVGVANFSVYNEGGYHLDFSVDNTGTGKRELTNQLRDYVNTGFRSDQYTDASPNPVAQFSSDDFTVPTTTQLTSITTDGFTNGNVLLDSTAISLSWYIYPDNAGNPAGNPQQSPGAAIWSYTASPKAAGVSTANAIISLDLAAAGQNISLPPGKYWLIVSARTLLANRWLWFAMNGGNGSFKTISISNTGTGSWTNNTSYSGLAMRLTGNVQCGASWIGAATPSMGRIEIDGGTDVAVQVSAIGLAVGTYEGYACFSSNDPVRPKLAGRVILNVTP